MLNASRIKLRAAEFLPNGKDVAVNAVSNAFTQALSGYNTESKEAIDLTANNQVIVDVIAYHLQGDLELSALLEMIKVADLNSHVAAASALVDALWMIGTQVSPEEGTVASDARSSHWTSLCALTKQIHDASLVPADVMKLSLEFNLLCGAGIVKDEAQLKLRLVKSNTKLMYKQQKYNMLREESEGYSKLFTLLGCVPAPPADPGNHVRYIASVIGYFDLDPNRVLDIVLDAFEQQLWNMSFIDVLQAFKKASIVHILGFKYSGYQQLAVDAGSVSENDPACGPTAASGKGKSSADGTADNTPTVVATPAAPHSLYLLTAILISYGLVDLDDLIPYLNPTAAETCTACDVETAKLTAELKAYGVVSLSGKASDQPAAANTTQSSMAPTLPGKPSYAKGNQLFGLLAAAYELKLLTVAVDVQRVLDTAQCKLTSSFCNEVRDALVELIVWRTEPVYEPIGFKRLNLAGGSFASNSKSKSNSLPNLPGQCSQVTSIHEFMPEIAPMLYNLSHHLGTSPTLFTRVCRILKEVVRHYVTGAGDKSAMEVDGSAGFVDVVPAEVINVLSAIMLPSLSRSKSVAAPSAQLLWTVLEELPFQVRFSLYGEWKGCGLGKEGLRAAPGQPKKDVIVCFAEAKVLLYAKAQLKRLSKDNVKQMARSLSNATHSCPLISYTHILNSIQVFDNLIPFVVDALKYTTDLSRDVMAYALVSQLQKDSEKLKPGDTHYSQWFASLSKFIATFYRKYPATCLDGLLHFLVGSLSKGESLDLLVLRELLTKMGGCETMLDVSQSQLEGLSGGKHLQAETMGGQTKEGVPKKAIRHLRDELIKTDTAFPLLYLISKIRSTIIFNMETTHLKLVSHMYDVCQDVLMQFTEFLVLGGLSGSSSDERSEKLAMLASTFPSLEELLTVGELPLAVAFQLIRPLVRLSLESCAATATVSPSASDKEKARAAAEACVNLDNCPAHLLRWHPFSPAIANAIASASPEGGWPEGISMEFYSLYWSLSMYDLKMPISRYQLELRRLRERCSELDGTGKPSADDAEKPKSQRAAELKKANATLKVLHDEMGVQQRHVNIISELLLLKKDQFFSPVDDKALQALNEQFVQHCVLHRTFLSPVDAVYGTQFFMQLHIIVTPKYRFLSFVDKFMKLMIPLIFSSTEYEASFLGHAINDILTVVNQWGASSEAFAKETQNESYQKFNMIYGLWNIRLKNVIKNGIESKEYMIIRSSMVLLSKIAQNFPTRKKIGAIVLEAVEALEKAETGRSDLSLMAKSLATMLKRNAPSWLEDEGKKAAPPAIAIAAAVSSAPAVPVPVVAAALPAVTVPSTNDKKNSSESTNAASSSSSSGKKSSSKPSSEATATASSQSVDPPKDKEKEGRESRPKETSTSERGKDREHSKDQPKERDSKDSNRSKDSSKSRSEGKNAKEDETSSKDSKKKEESKRSGSTDRHAAPPSRSDSNGQESSRQFSDKGKDYNNDKSSSRGKRDRDDVGGSASSARSGVPPRDNRNRDRGDNNKGDGDAAPRKPMSSRLTSGGSSNSSNDLKGGQGGRGKDSSGNNRDSKDDGQHQSKRARRS